MTNHFAFSEMYKSWYRAGLVTLLIFSMRPGQVHSRPVLNLLAGGLAAFPAGFQLGLIGIPFILAAPPLVANIAPLGGAATAGIGAAVGSLAG